MQSLYQEKDLSAVRSQIRRRSVLLWAILATGIALLVFLLMKDDHKQNRPELAATLTLILTGALLIFLYDLLIHPLRKYASHIDESLHGRSHEVSVVFDHLNEETSLVDGVHYRDLIFLGDADKHGDRERRFYWDQELPLPSFEKGQAVTLKYYDRFITGYAV